MNGRKGEEELGEKKGRGKEGMNGRKWEEGMGEKREGREAGRGGREEIGKGRGKMNRKN